MSTKCETCGHYFEARHHKCPPGWLVWCPDLSRSEDDAKKVYAYDAEAAAEEWVERAESNDSDFSVGYGDLKVVVWVRPAANATVKARRFEVSGGIDLVYSADEIEEETEGAA